MKLYLSGPMSGYPDHNFPAFKEWAWKLRGMGYYVTDPSDWEIDPDESWEECLRRDLRDMLRCDALALLHDWKRSRGACLEVHVARELGMECKAVEEWQP